MEPRWGELRTVVGGLAERFEGHGLIGLVCEDQRQVGGHMRCRLTTVRAMPPTIGVHHEC
jgi:hypothetical protein